MQIKKLFIKENGSFKQVCGFIKINNNFQLYTDCASELIIGDIADDGYMAFAQQGDQMLLAPPQSENVNRDWGSYGTTRGTTSTTDGYNNTNTLQAFGSSAHPAAHHVWNHSRTPSGFGGGGTGSYLPAEDELQLIYNNRVMLDQDHTSATWSSTESGSNNARGLNFGNGSLYSYGKGSSRLVIPLRRVTVE